VQNYFLFFLSFFISLTLHPVATIPFDETALAPWHSFTPAPQGLPAIYIPLSPIFSFFLLLSLLFS
jgi:hypothetical protein